MSTNDAAALRLGDIPVVFMSYDEPWATDFWRDLTRKRPDAIRVHGIKGLDACHKAAADAVSGDWVITVDADTKVDARLWDVTIAPELLKEQYRLDWLSRNAVNGLWSGNGSVKLWSRRMVRQMRSHEAAGPGAPALDHDIGAVMPGHTCQLPMPARLSTTWPAMTAYHAFRCGMRETVFLHAMALGEQNRHGLKHLGDTAAARLLRIWCSLGRHADNGLWVLFGARLGLVMPHLTEDWDPRQVNDYNWFASFWAQHIVPRFKHGHGWDWSRLEARTRALAPALGTHLGLVIEEIEQPVSQIIAQSDLLSPSSAASPHDTLGYRQMLAARSPQDAAIARRFLEVARMLDHPAAFENIGTLHSGPLDARPSEAVWHLSAAQALGNVLSAKKRHIVQKATPDRPACLACDFDVICLYDPACEMPDPDLNVEWIDAANRDALHESLAARGARPCFIFDPLIRPGARFMRHVPDLDFAQPGGCLGYGFRCETTGHVHPNGVTFGRACDLARDTCRDAAPVMTSLPVVLGYRALFTSCAQAVLAAQRDAKEGAETDIWTPLVGLARGAPFGADYINARTPDASQHIIWTDAASRGFKSMLTDIPPADQWDMAARTCANDTLRNMLIRTRNAVWGTET